MSAHDVFAQMFDVGKDILVTYLNAETNVILAQIGDSTASVPDADAAEWWQHTGFWSRPALPTQGGASCQGLIIKRGDRDVVYATRDTRNSSIYGKLADGETCVGASTGQARTFYKADGSIQHVTSVGNTAGGTTFIVSQASDGSYTIQAPTALFKMAADGSITLGNTTGGITIDAAGNVKIFGVAVHVQASAVAAISGDVVTQLGPVPAIAGLGSIGVAYTSTATAGPATGSKNVVVSP
jgi:hypothetical protein